jgi:hypothetical protein
VARVVGVAALMCINNDHDGDQVTATSISAGSQREDTDNSAPE